MSRLPSYKTRDKQIHAFGCRQRIVRAAAAVADELATKAILTRPEAQLLDAVQEYRREHPAHSTFPQTQSACPYGQKDCPGGALCTCGLPKPSGEKSCS